MNYKYEAFLDAEGRDVNDPSRYLPPRDISQEERDRAYDDELAQDTLLEARGLVDSYNYLYRDDDESGENVVDALLASRFSAKHTRRSRRSASLQAKTRKIALGMPEVTKEYRTVLGIKTSVHQNVHSAQSLLKAHSSARASLCELRKEFLNNNPTGDDINGFINLDNYYRSFLLSGSRRIVVDVEFTGDGKTAIPVYGTSIDNEFHKYAHIARKGRALFKLAKHYDVFSPNKKRFFNKASRRSQEMVDAPQEVSKGPKKFWTQEEIAAAKALEILPAHRQRVQFVNSTHTSVQDKSFGKHSGRATRNDTASQLIMVPHVFRPLFHFDVLRGYMM
ncbi:MAG: hypothetical protein HFJ51_07030 [Clostridia bacterium]|nr:hypothetical protein [Clostridia bacterium]